MSNKARDWRAGIRASLVTPQTGNGACLPSTSCKCPRTNLTHQRIPGGDRRSKGWVGASHLMRGAIRSFKRSLWLRDMGFSLGKGKLSGKAAKKMGRPPSFIEYPVFL